LSPSLRGIQWEAVPPARRTHIVLADGGLTEGDTGRFLSPSLRGIKGEEPLRALGDCQLLCGSNFNLAAEHHNPLRFVACRQRNASPLVKGDKVTNVGRTSVHELAILLSFG
jgi:hypothetical protein